MEPTDRSALDEIFRQHAGTIYNLGLRVCRTPEEAEDLVQETFLRAHTAWEGFEGRSKASTWLWTIAVRACQRMTRKRSGEPERLASLEEILPSPGDDVPLIPAADGPDALDELVRKEVQTAVERAIGELPEGFRLPLVLRDVAELPVADIARIMDLKENTVRTRVHRARLLLRNAFSTRFPARPAPASHRESRQCVCLDLLRSKLTALDKGVRFDVADEELCERCRSMFAGLDLAHDACRRIREGELPPALAAQLQRHRGQGTPADR